MSLFDWLKPRRSKPVEPRPPHPGEVQLARIADLIGGAPLDPGGPETYRFVYSRAFYDPIAVRFASVGQRFPLRAAVLPWKSQPIGTEPRVIELALAPEEWASWKAELEAVDFWRLEPTVQFRGMDGSNWSIEAVCDGRSHKVERWSPMDFDVLGEQVFKRRAPITRLGVLALALARIELPPRELV